MSAPLTLRIDGRQLQAEPGEPLLQVARKAGIEIPTLCDHPALEPVGACRLCMVEVTHPDWKGWSGLMTACLYPAAPGLEVRTDSDNVRRARRQVLSLLAARCPGVPAIQALAAQYGATTDGLSVDPQADRCILCGLCTRVCESFATSAITTFSRGSTKAVGSFFGNVPQECVGCGACAAVCPTDNIPVHSAGAHFEIWRQSFDAAPCTVDIERCVGCGACEETCPFAVVRVRLSSTGERFAQIPPEHCRGCGACVGACPTGAIDQAAPYGNADLRSLARKPKPPRLAVLACTRCGLSNDELPEGSRLIHLPCTGRVTPVLLLDLVSRYQGVLVLGRHPETCRLGAAEEHAQERCARVGALLELIGLGADRIRFALADSGPGGPQRTIAAFLEELGRLEPSPLCQRRPPLVDGDGLEQGLALLRWMAGEQSLRPDHAWLEQHALPAAGPGEPRLNPGELLLFELLAGSQARPLSAVELLRQGLEVLSGLGVHQAGIALGPLSKRDQSLAARLTVDGAKLPRPTKPVTVACDGSPRSCAVLEALGYSPLPLESDAFNDGLRLDAEARRRADELLARAEAGGAVALLCESPAALARWALLTRDGSWRSGRLRPLLAHQLAWASLRGMEVAP